MTGDPKDSSSINTGGGAYIGGNVDTGGGTFVGRDQVITSHSGVSLEELRRLVAELGRLLPQAGLPKDLTEVIEGDFKVVEQQASKDSPNGGIIKNKLSSLLGLVNSAGNTAGALEKIISVASKATQIAGLLFP
jgi:hypothetical protein